MKICFLSSLHPLTDKRVYDKEAVSLAAAGHTVFHLAPGECDIKPCNGIQFISYPLPRGLLGRVTQMFRLYQMARSINADCYHCNEIDSWFVGIFLKLFLGKCIVFDVHEHYPSSFGVTHLPSFLHPLSAIVIRIVYMLLVPWTDRVVLAKRTIASDIGQKWKHVLVQNYARLSADRFDAPVLSEKPVPIKSRITAIHLGYISRNRGWPQMVEAMSLLENPGVNLQLLGQFNDGTYEEFCHEVQNTGLKDRVVSSSWLPFDKAMEEVRNADIGLVMFQPGIVNNEFALPHKLFDYMLAGIPVIIPKCAKEITDIVLESDCGLIVNSACPQEIAEAISRLSEDADLRKRLGQNGRRAVFEKYNWENEAEKLVNMYLQLEETLVPAHKQAKETQLQQNDKHRAA